MNGPENLLVGEEVIKAQVLDRSSKLLHGTGIAAEFVLGIGDADLHAAVLHALQFRAGGFPVPWVPRWSTATSVIVDYWTTLPVGRISTGVPLGSKRWATPVLKRVSTTSSDSGVSPSRSTTSTTKASPSEMASHRR